MEQKKYGDISLKKADQIITMAQLTNVCTVETESVCIDPSTLFYCLVIVGERISNLRECFNYELTPYPMSLFKDGLMRKSDKPSLYKNFVNETLPPCVQYVVDGGYLLHKVRWYANMDVCEIIPLFLKYF